MAIEIGYMIYPFWPLSRGAPTRREATRPAFDHKGKRRKRSAVARANAPRANTNRTPARALSAARLTSGLIGVFAPSSHCG
jgi:hypothetical protein